jgi:hypothetical protein
MVTQAINEDLLRRIQNYVTTDVNSKREPDAHVKPEDVYILSFTRVLNNWKALVVIMSDNELHYDIVHDGTQNVTLVTVYEKRTTQSAII